MSKYDPTPEEIERVFGNLSAVCTDQPLLEARVYALGWIMGAVNDVNDAQGAARAVRETRAMIAAFDRFRGGRA